MRKIEPHQLPIYEPKFSVDGKYTKEEAKLLNEWLQKNEVKEVRTKKEIVSLLCKGCNETKSSKRDFIDSRGFTRKLCSSCRMKVANDLRSSQDKKLIVSNQIRNYFEAKVTN